MDLAVRSAGLKVVAPGWAGMEDSVEELRRNPAPIAEMQVETILEHYVGTIRDLNTAADHRWALVRGAFTQVPL
jgi:hypothetical protein